MKHLYYMRHGQSTANQAMIWSGQLDAPLSEQGVQEAHAAGKKAANAHFKADLMLCSPLIRAAKTAEILASYIGYPIDNMQTDPRLMERSFGDIEGTPIASVMPDFNHYHLLDTIPTVEKLADLQERAQKVFDEVKMMPQDTILIVGHAAFGRALRRVVNGLPYTAEYEGEFKQIPNAEIIQLI